MLGFAYGQVSETQANCTFSTFQPPAGYTFSAITGIDLAGTVIGQVENTNTQQDIAFTRTPDGTFTTYAAPNSYTTMWTKKNNVGVTVGWFQSALDGNIHGLIQQGGTVSIKDYPGAQSTWLSAINDSSAVVGSFLKAGGQDTGFQYAKGRSTLLKYPGALSTSPYGISNTGIIVGTENDAFTYHGFVLRSGTYSRLDHPKGNLGTILEDVNRSGVIVGNYETGNVDFYGFVYKAGNFEDIVYPGARAVVGANNDSGVIAGQLYGLGLAYTAVCQ
jgi:hypothetical protein